MPRTAGTDSTNTPASKARISLRADIDKLMDYFLLTESVRYQEFARVWHALNFALIFVGLKDNKDKKEFIQDAFELVSEYLQPPFDLQRRVCALYTLYGLYYTQTHHPRIKIRMSLEDWKETLSLHDDLQEQGHLDALYVFHKMRLDKAFMFTATHAPMFYQGRAKKPEDFERWAAKHQSFMASVLDEDLLQELEQVHTSYKDGKQEPTVQGDVSLAIVQDSMSDYIMERISNIDVPNQTDSETEAVAESRSRSSRIREIKKRSFASPTQLSKARRSRAQHGDESTTDDPAYSPFALRSRRRGKRRGRGRPRKSDSDVSFSSPSRKKRKNTSDLSFTPENACLGSDREKKSHSKKTPLTSAAEDASTTTPKDKPEKGTPKAEGASSSKKKKKRSPKKIKDALKSKKKVSSTENEEGKSPVKKKKKKRKSSSSGKADGESPPKSDKRKTRQAKKKEQTTALAKVRPLRSMAKKSPPGSKKTVKMKVEPSEGKGNQALGLSPRKRPRKSSSPRRLVKPQDDAESGKKT